MAHYEIRFVTHAEEQRDRLPPDGRRALNARLAGIAEDPYRGAVDQGDNSWTHTFGTWGMILYTVSNRIVTVTVLRITW